MNKGIDIKFIEEQYRQISDDALIRLATQDAHGLTPEAVEVVKTEIQKRGLDANMINGLQAQNKEHTIESIDAYCDMLSELSCPICGNNTERLNATLTGEVMSFILFTSYNKKLKIGCPACLDKANNSALAKTSILGWWGFPWGIIRTPMAIALNIKSKRTNHSLTHNDYMRAFTMAVIGELETYKSDKEKLQEIILRHNNQ